METLSNFPYFEVEFDLNGTPVDTGEIQDILDFPGERLTDILIMCHGWNNDMNDARGLYRNFFSVVRGVLDQGNVAGDEGRQFGVVGILWPSKKFAEADLIPGGAAAFDPDAAVQDALDRLKTLFDSPEARQKVEQAKALADRLEDGEQAQDAWMAKIRELLPARSQDQEDASNRFFALPGSEVLKKLQSPLTPSAPPTGEGGGAAGFGNFFGGVQNAALQALNFATYYLMKDRAGIVGHGGVKNLIRTIQGKFPNLRIHLIGHSFGARVVTAAADALDDQSSVSSMTLLQAAFSHYGFAHDYEPGSDGLFRKVVTEHKVSGPILISHSVRDTAVGIAYAIASQIAGQIASAFGDQNDRYGGLGRNGAQITPEAVDGDLQPVGRKYSFTGGRIYNLTADNIIMSHSDICKPEVAYALLTAVASADAREQKPAAVSS